jgi:hypothetical protein
LVVESVPRAKKVLTHTIMLAFPYTYLERVRLLVASQAGTVFDEEFAADVTLTAGIMVEKLPALQASLSDLTKGKVQAVVIETKEVLFPQPRERFV